MECVRAMCVRVQWYVRHQANTLYHPVGTCKMGSASDASAVVDPRLRVLGGVKRLRVADASVMPLIVSGNTNVPAIMIGEKCADLCRQDRDEEEQAAKQGRASTAVPTQRTAAGKLGKAKL